MDFMNCIVPDVTVLTRVLGGPRVLSGHVCSVGFTSLELTRQSRKVVWVAVNLCDSAVTLQFSLS